MRGLRGREERESAGVQWVLERGGVPLLGSAKMKSGTRESSTAPVARFPSLSSLLELSLFLLTPSPIIFTSSPTCRQHYPTQYIHTLFPFNSHSIRRKIPKFSLPSSNLGDVNLPHHALPPLPLPYKHHRTRELSPYREQHSPRRRNHRDFLPTLFSASSLLAFPPPATRLAPRPAFPASFTTSRQSLTSFFS